VFVCDVKVTVTGVTVLLAVHSDDSDMLWLISSDNFPFRSLVSESHVCNVTGSSCTLDLSAMFKSRPNNVDPLVALALSTML